MEIHQSWHQEHGIADVLDTLGDVAWAADDLRAGVPYYEESLALRRRLGMQRPVAMSLYSLGRLYVDHKLNEAAAACFAEALPTLETLGDQRGLALTINGVGRIALNEQQHTLAGERFREALQLFYQLGNKVDMAECLEELALVAFAMGEGERAATLWAAGEALRQEIRVYTLIYNQQLAAPMLSQIGNQSMADARLAVQRHSLKETVAYALQGVTRID